MSDNLPRWLRQCWQTRAMISRPMFPARIKMAGRNLSDRFPSRIGLDDFRPDRTRRSSSPPAQGWSFINQPLAALGLIDAILRGELSRLMAGYRPPRAESHPHPAWTRENDTSRPRNGLLKADAHRARPRPESFQALAGWLQVRPV